MQWPALLVMVIIMKCSYEGAQVTRWAWVLASPTHLLQLTYKDPQGSVLGPLLFLLYVDDLTTVTRVCKLKLFADDVLLYFNVNSVEDCQLLQVDLSAIVEWSKQWQLNLNPQNVRPCVSPTRENQFCSLILLTINQLTGLTLWNI